jgi:HK97 gp10 family phage protein
MAMRSQLFGAAELDRMFGRIKTVADREVAERALTAGGQPIAEAARERVHRDKGYLADSIKVGPDAVGAGGGGGPRVFVGPGQDPAGIQEEFGNSDQDAHPFLTPAFEAKRGAAIDAIAGVLRDDLGNKTKG